MPQLPFEALLPPQLLAAAKCCVVPPQGHITKSSEPVRHFYLLRQGSAKLIYDDPESEPLIIDIYHAGDFFGEMEMAGVATQNRSIIAMSRCELLQFTRAQFDEMWQNNNAFSRWLLAVHCRRLLRAGDDKIYSDKAVLYGRAFRHIQSHLNDKGYFLYTKQVLAEMLGTSIRSLNRTLQQLENDRLIVVSSGTIKLNID